MKPMLLTREGSDLVLQRRVVEFKARKNVGEPKPTPYLPQYTSRERWQIRTFFGLILLACSGWGLAAWLALR